MPGTSAVLDEARQLVESRLAELDEERKRLERALAELGGKAGGRLPGRPLGRKPTRTATATGAAEAAAPRKRRKRRGGTIADRAVELIEKTPGVSASDAAKKALCGVSEARGWAVLQAGVMTTTGMGREVSAW
jgi:hypothetical protein